ncbi:MAG: hypothetical protein IKW04_06660, partial [Clostridia bacterium]|nr:hypothetical protein [Clostridia bacterium]
NPAKVTKWTAKSGLNYEVDAGASKTLKLSDIFTLNNNYKVGNVTYTVEGQGTKTVSGSAWANTQIDFTKGTCTVTITDDLFSDATYEATVKVTEKVVEPVYKFKAVDKYIYLEHSTPEADGTITKDKDNGALTLGDVFVSTGNSTITNANVVATATASDYAEDVKDYTSTAKATITKSGSDWTQWPVTITGVGELTFTITDNDNCLTSQAIVGVSPYWIGDADGDDVIEGYEPPHYESSTYKYRLSTSVANLAKGDEKEITFNGLSESGIYAFCFNVNAATTLQVRCGNYSTIITMNQAGWTDAYGADEVLYITAGSKIYVKNLGNGAVTINGNETANRSMATYLCGADDMDFFPLVKWNSYQAGNLELPDPDDGEVPTPTPTPTPGADIPPIPAKTFDTWNGAYGSVNTTYGTQYWPGGAKKYEGSKISNYATDYYKAKGGSVTYTYNAPYTGVYVFQTYAGDYTKGTATFEVSVPGGYTWEVKRTSTGWSSADKTDLLIYLEKGENDIVVTWTGEGSAGLYEIDMGLFNESGDYSSMAFYDVCMSKLK